MGKSSRGTSLDTRRRQDAACAGIGKRRLVRLHLWKGAKKGKRRQHGGQASDTEMGDGNAAIDELIAHAPDIPVHNDIPYTRAQQCSPDRDNRGKRRHQGKWPTFTSGFIGAARTPFEMPTMDDTRKLLQRTCFRSLGLYGDDCCKLSDGAKCRCVARRGKTTAMKKGSRYYPHSVGSEARRLCEAAVAEMCQEPRGVLNIRSYLRAQQ